MGQSHPYLSGHPQENGKWYDAVVVVVVVILEERRARGYTYLEEIHELDERSQVENDETYKGNIVGDKEVANEGEIKEYEIQLTEDSDDNPTSSSREGKTFLP